MIDIERICQTSDVWDRRTLALWRSAQARHKGRIQLVPKETRHIYFATLTVLMAIVNSLFVGISAIFDRRRSIIDGFRDGYRETPDLTYGDFTTFGYRIYVSGDGNSFQFLPPQTRFAILWHQLSHIDWIYLGYPHCAERHFEQPQQGFLARLYGRYINANMIRIMWLLWRFPFGSASFRKEFEYIGFLCEVRVDLYSREDMTSSTSASMYADLFSGPQYGYMATRKGGRDMANEMIEQAANELRNGWIEQKMQDLDNTFRSVEKWSRMDDIRGQP